MGLPHLNTQNKPTSPKSKWTLASNVEKTPNFKPLSSISCLHHPQVKEPFSQTLKIFPFLHTIKPEITIPTPISRNFLKISSIHIFSHKPTTFNHSSVASSFFLRAKNTKKPLDVATRRWKDYHGFHSKRESGMKIGSPNSLWWRRRRRISSPLTILSTCLLFNWERAYWIF